jgi:hypothetical protein
MHPQTASQDTDALSDWTYSETIDDETSTIRVRGHVDRLGVDLLRATIEELDRRGHAHITVTIERSSGVDTCAQVVLAEAAAHLASRNSRLTVTWAADESHLSGRLGEQPGPHVIARRGPRPATQTSERSRDPG